MSRGSPQSHTAPPNWRRWSHALRIGSGLAAVLALTSPARADVIDGDWCHDDGRRFSIRGPTIVTPGGTTLQGDYTRHSFEYTTPPNEAGSGQPVTMTLRSETRVDVRVGGPSDSFQAWHRCTATTS
jgi:hypothetical protein